MRYEIADALKYHNQLINLIVKKKCDELTKCNLETFINSDEAEVYNFKELEEIIKEA